MGARHWMFFTTILMAIAARPVVGQDLSFLQPAFDLAAQATERSTNLTFGPRFVDAASIQRAFGAAGLPVPSMSELEDGFDRPEQQQSVVDSLYAAVIIGSPDDPRLRAIDERRQRTIMVRVDEWPEQVRWVRDDGMVFRVQEISPLSGQEGYRIHLIALATAGKYFVGPSLGGQHIVVTVVRRDGEWVTPGTP